MAKITTALFGELSLLPFQAEAPVVESLEWLTDVIEVYDGSNDDEIQLRPKPRQWYEYSLPIQHSAFAKAFNTVYGGVRAKWAVPVWTDAQYVGTVAAGATSIACDTVNYDLRAASLALVYRYDAEWQVVEIDTIAADSITLVDPATEIRAAFIIPLRVGYIEDSPQNNTRGYNSKFNVRFAIDEDVLAYSPAAPTQYLGNDVYFNASLLEGGGLNRSFLREQIKVDSGLGLVDRSTPWTYTRYTSPFKTITTTAAERKAYRDFLYRRAGKARRFWLPTFESNLRLTNVGNIVNTITIERDCFNDYTYRPHIAFEDASGWTTRTLSNPVPVTGDRLQLTLSSALNKSAESIRRVSYMGLHRLDTDRVEIRTLGGNVAESTVPVVELQP
jgi:hypothetical protein